MNMIHVVIPVYNAEKYLQAAVDSVLQQPCKSMDIILINDGSTDGSGALCDAIAAREERVAVLHQKNAGVSAARNAGIDYMLQHCDDSDFLAFLDADDLWVPGVFTDALCSRMYAEKQTDLFAFDGCRANTTLTRFSRPYDYEDKVIEGGDSAIWCVPGHFCAILYRAALLRKWGIRFMDGLKYSEDKIFQHQCLFLTHSVHFIPHTLHICRENSTSAMKKVYSLDQVAYFTPIINGWLRSDQFLNGLSAKSGRTTRAGTNLASVYFLDMAQEHYERWHRPSRLYAAYAAHPDSYLLEQMDQKAASEKQYRNRTFLLQHPVLYQLKYNAIGAIKYLARIALRNRFVANRWERRKYPLTEMPR